MVARALIMACSIFSLAALPERRGPGGRDGDGVRVGEPERAGAGPVQPPERVDVKAGGRTFHVDLAADDPTRVKGLGGRASIPDDGGMLFVFPYPTTLDFVMRDCAIPIDIAFLDSSGRVLATHAMVAETPQGATESSESYEKRLKRYSSRFPAQFAVEFQGGMIAKLGLKPGDLVRLDAEGLKRRAR